MGGQDVEETATLADPSTVAGQTPPPPLRKRGGSRTVVISAQIIGLVLIVAAPLLINDFSILVLTEILVFGLFGTSLDLLIGVTGLPSLGHAAYYGIGAYSAALFSTHVSANGPLQLLVGLVAGAAGAAITGWVTVRTRAVYFLMLTVAITEVVFSLVLSWTAVTGGTNGLTVPVTELLPGVGLTLDGYIYWYVLAVVVIGYLIVRLIAASPFGRALVGIKENEPRMRALGYPTSQYKFAAYCLAGSLAGVAGSLSVTHTRFVSPDVASFTTAALVFITVIVGGSGTLYGAFLGAAVVILVRDELSTLLPGRSTLVLGVIFVIVIYLLPQGLAGGFRQLLSGALGRRVRAEADNV